MLHCVTRGAAFGIKASGHTGISKFGAFTRCLETSSTRAFLNQGEQTSNDVITHGKNDAFCRGSYHGVGHFTVCSRTGCGGCSLFALLALYRANELPWILHLVTASVIYDREQAAMFVTHNEVLGSDTRFEIIRVVQAAKVAL
ncbi:hypothetical protein FI667_g10421, partial [Globisporangium splendens]